MNIIYKQDNFRIIELPEYSIDFDDLKGDCFNPTVNPEIDSRVLKKQELDFEKKVESEGVYFYVLEKWSPIVDEGWQTIDSCGGFIGMYQFENHYIVDVFKNQIKSEV